MNSEHVYAVIAGRYPEYAEWCRERGISPRTGPAFYVTLASLRGRRDVEVVRVGTWPEREDLPEIEEMLAVINRTGARR